MSRVVLVEASIFQLEVGVLRKDLNGTHSKDDNDDLAILTHNRVYEVVAIDNCANVPTSFFFFGFGLPLRLGVASGSGCGQSLPSSSVAFSVSVRSIPDPAATVSTACRQASSFKPRIAAFVVLSP